MSLLFAAAAAAAFLVPATSAEPKVLDLSEDFPVGNTDNPGANSLEDKLGPDIRRMLVLENGTIVMEYQREDVDDEELFNLHSATKSFMALFIGVVMEKEKEDGTNKYNLTLNHDLGDIFTDEAAWANIEDDNEKAFKKNITVEQLFTMTSGLDDGVGLNPFPIFGNSRSLPQPDLYRLFDIPNAVGNTLEELRNIKNLKELLDITNAVENTLEDLIDIPNAVGKNLEESLSIPDHQTKKKGEFWYLAASNILSYVLKNVTGETPLDFVSREIFRPLGIDQSEVRWDANDDGVQTSFSNLHLTARGMAKLTQLFLQKGLAAPDKRIVSEEFIDGCLSKLIENPLHFRILGFKNNSYGYLWNTVSEITDVHGDVSCAWGYNGQIACLNYSTARVSVVQRDVGVFDDINSNNFWDFDFNPFNRDAFKIAIEAMTTSLTFTTDDRSHVTSHERDL